MHGTHFASTLSRRHFILTAATAAGGFMIGIGTAPRAASAATVTAEPWDTGNGYSPNDIDAWIAIDPDDSILIRYQRSEMGQGTMTALPMMISEELQCDWSKVRIEYASANRNIREDRVYGDMFSHGSMSVRQSQKKVQQVGASARERLIAAAAARWNVPASECAAAQSVVTHKPSGQSLRYGELAADAAKIKLAAEPAIKTPAQFTFIPKPLPRVDVVHKTDGSAKFGIDAQVPDMVFAAITACPVPGGKLKSVDETVLAGAPGTRYMVNPRTIAEQAEGAVIFGLTAALYGKITIKDGAAVEGNFDTYRMVRLVETPKIDVHLVPSGGEVWGGAGEPAVPPIAAAVANAIFAATGKRIRSLPISDHDLKGSTG
jgi:isoquinoline 1-oxidoreductase beta subunit